ncbi:prepilin peptidase [Nocardioides bruguierae]|uniref:prepilin peptidase n=1 Tax=Nocardioides bruguierae TaxID=2945102 RepID=UPI0020223887|nr:prepilin peptidase [Nocardioides bruguierae]MCL8024237.1 prepilin peptidase [Nocardioides bruguierae]
MDAAPLITALVAALVVGVLGACAPAVVRRLPAPAGEPHPDDPPRPSWDELASGRWLALGCGLAAAAAAALLTLALGAGWWLAWLLPVVPVAAWLAVIDARTRLLPRVLVLPATAVVLVVALLEWLVAGHGRTVLVAVLLALAARSVFWVLWRVNASGLGFGDVRLALLLGLPLARLGPGELVLGLWLGFLLVGAAGLGRVVARRDRSLLRSHVPLGPGLIVGALLGALLGGALL